MVDNLVCRLLFAILKVLVFQQKQKNFIILEVNDLDRGKILQIFYFVTN